MMESGRYLYVSFMCQQALEKLLKAIYVKVKNELPARTHNLLYLREILDINVNDQDLLLLSQLNQYYLESRYPGDRAKLAKEVNKQSAKDILEKTKGFWKCLMKNLT